MSRYGIRTGMSEAREHWVFLLRIEIALWNGKTLCCAGLRSAFRISSGLTWLGVWYGARLHLALGLTHAQWATLIRAGLARSSVRLSSVSVLARNPTRLGSRLHSRLGSARLRSGSIRFGFGRYSRFWSARLEAGLYWLETFLSMARGSGLGSGLGLALGLSKGQGPA